MNNKRRFSGCQYWPLWQQLLYVNINIFRSRSFLEQYYFC
jgi:hypothetical protein